MTLQEKLAAGQFVTLVELEPPKGADLSHYVSQAVRVKAEADAFLVPDMRDAVMGMSAWGGALALLREGLETVVHISGRDRNRLALQGDLLSLYAHGIRSLVVMRGEEPAAGDHPQAKAVGDLELEEILAMVTALSQGRDLAGRTLKGAPRFFLGSFLNLWKAGKLGGALEDLEKRSQAGAEFFITPPVFDVEGLVAFRERLAGRDVCIIPNVLVLKSVAMAQGLRLHAKQVHMPDGMVSRIKKAKDRVAECLAITVELIDGIRRAGFSGVMISPAGWEDKLPLILQASR